SMRAMASLASSTADTFFAASAADRLVAVSKLQGDLAKTRTPVSLIEPMMAQFSPRLQGAFDGNCDAAAPQSSCGGRWQPRLRRAAACIAQKRKQKPAHFAGLFLLHPMSGAIDEVAADHVRAGLGLHRLEHAGTLIGAPVLLAGDEGRGNVDGAARPGLQFRR